MMRQLCVQHDSPVSLAAVAAPGNNFGDAGAKALCPALEKLSKLKFLHFDRACGDVQRRSSTQCVRVGGGAGERAGQVAMVVVCDGLFSCDVRGVWSVC